MTLNEITFPLPISITTPLPTLVDSVLQIPLNTKKLTREEKSSII